MTLLVIIPEIKRLNYERQYLVGFILNLKIKSTNILKEIQRFIRTELSVKRSNLAMYYSHYHIFYGYFEHKLENLVTLDFIDNIHTIFRRFFNEICEISLEVKPLKRNFYFLLMHSNCISKHCVT